MKIRLLWLLFIPLLSIGQYIGESIGTVLPTSNYIRSVDNLSLEAAFELTKRVTASATTINKNVSIAILDASGTIILLVRGEGVGPHNTEAARRKAYTALTTKTATFTLLRNAEMNLDLKNVTTLPELLLLGGRVPILYKGTVIGSVGVAGVGSPEKDDVIVKSAEIAEMVITIIK